MASARTNVLFARLFAYQILKVLFSQVSEFVGPVLLSYKYRIFKVAEFQTFSSAVSFRNQVDFEIIIFQVSDWVAYKVPVILQVLKVPYRNLKVQDHSSFRF